MSGCARACACGLPPTATVDGLEIEAAGPVVLLGNFPDLFRGSLWLRLVSRSSSFTQGDPDWRKVEPGTAFAGFPMGWP